MRSEINTESTANTEGSKDPLTGVVIGAAIAVHRELRPGLLESTYQQCLLTYMKHAEAPVGLIINFYSKLLKDGIKRFVI